MEHNKQYLIGFAIGVITPLLVIQTYLTFQTIAKGETYVLQSPFVLLDEGKQQEMADSLALNMGDKKR